MVHYELPNSSENFVHRSGRTGRAGKKGSVVLIYSDHQYREIKAIEREVGCRFVEASFKFMYSPIFDNFVFLVCSYNFYW